eukprot:13330749-Heterocapsa_arctica.AAC.1
MLDPATWIKQVPGPPLQFTWGRPGDLPSTAGGVPNGSTSATGHATAGTHGNNKRANVNPESRDRHSGGGNPDQAPGEPHHPGA